MRKRELRAVLSADLFIKIDKLRRLYGGISRSGIVAIAVKEMFDRELEGEAAPSKEQRAA
jgi:hypothetical protein